MAEIQEQRHICKICSKSCANGRSLGGHMRLHVPRKGASSKIKIEKEVEENGYGLRANPKQSWRVSHQEQGIVSCQECGEEFPTSKTLLTHMKVHSELFHCKKCGRGFDSIRAMFGHMKTHSKKFRHNKSAADDDEGDESRHEKSSADDDEGGHGKSAAAADEGLPVLVANLCPVRRKRSRIKYTVAPSASFSSLNESGNLDEEAEMRMAAVSLIMLSRGVRDWRELSDEDLGFGKELKVGSADQVLGTKGLVESADDDKANMELLKSDSWKGKGVLGSGDSDSESSAGSENDNDSIDGLVEFEKKRKRSGSMDVITSFYQSVTEASLRISQLGYSSVDQIEQVASAVNYDSAGIRGRLDLNFPGKHKHVETILLAD